MQHLRSTLLRAPLALTLALAAVVLVTLAAAPAGSPQGGPKEEGPLHVAMEELKSTMRKLGKELQEKDQEGSLPFVSAMQQLVLTGKDLVPPQAAKVPEAERKAFVQGYRIMMVELLRATCDLETAVLGKDFDKAQTLFRDVIKPMEDKGHEKYRPEEE